MVVVVVVVVAVGVKEMLGLLPSVLGGGLSPHPFLSPLGRYLSIHIRKAGTFYQSNLFTQLIIKYD